MRNNSVKLFEFGSVVQEEIVHKHFLSGDPFVQWTQTICVTLVEGT